MKILFIVHSLQIKSEWLFRLIGNLHQDIECIATNEPNLDRVHSSQKSLNPLSIKLVRKIDEKLNKKYFYPLILKKIQTKYSTEVNYVHFIGFAIKIQNFILNSKNPTIIHCHGKDIMWDLIDAKTRLPIHSNRYFSDLKNLVNNAYFLANSTFTRNQLLKQGVTPDRIFINYFGIDVKPEINKTENKSFKILYLGRLVDFKGPLEVILAFEKACDMGMKGELIIAGGGEMEQACRKLIMCSIYKDNIRLIGWVDAIQANELYENSDIFTAHNKKDKYTNQVEAFGVTIIEAMSHGLPVITGNSGGVSDSVVNEVTGYLIDSGNVDDHAKKFYKLYKDKKLRQKMGAEARRRVKEMFSPEKELENFYKIVKTVQEAHKKLIK
jgi:glycosyltransferase involved in cell wall biosynthesis